MKAIETIGRVALRRSTLRMMARPKTITREAQKGFRRPSAASLPKDAPGSATDRIKKTEYEPTAAELLAIKHANDLAFLLQEAARALKRGGVHARDWVPLIERTRMVWFSDEQIETFAAVRRMRHIAFVRALDEASEVYNEADPTYDHPINFAIRRVYLRLKEVWPNADDIDADLIEDAIEAWPRGSGRNSKWKPLNALATALQCGAAQDDLLRIELFPLIKQRRAQKPKA